MLVSKCKSRKNRSQLTVYIGNADHYHAEYRLDVVEAFDGAYLDRAKDLSVDYIVDRCCSRIDAFRHRLAWTHAAVNATAEIAGDAAIDLGNQAVELFADDLEKLDAFVDAILGAVAAAVAVAPLN